MDQVDVSGVIKYAQHLCIVPWKKVWNVEKKKPSVNKLLLFLCKLLGLSLSRSRHRPPCQQATCSQTPVTHPVKLNHTFSRQNNNPALDKHRAERRMSVLCCIKTLEKHRMTTPQLIYRYLMYLLCLQYVDKITTDIRNLNQSML